MQEFYASQGFQPSIPYPTYVPPVPTWFEPPNFLQDYGDGGGTSGSNRRWHSVQQTSFVESVLKTERPITQGELLTNGSQQKLEIATLPKSRPDILEDRDSTIATTPLNRDRGRRRYALH
ncbi:hypothetical protein L2E82_29914 [Cichorium intybus]|uniref:Uncharacterized protein n=1 Tax=Cichorium intybus TaxID=13427 RepID=A0ACB9CYU4_CICIN|nr:hypothetical protein L2E82_29914 [Cichorium intybus]